MSASARVPTVVVPGTAIALEALTPTVTRLRKVLRHLDRLTKERAALEARIKDTLGDAQVGTLAGRPAVSWRITSRMVLDQHELRQTYPLIVKECSHTSTYRAFKLVRR